MEEEKGAEPRKTEPIGDGGDADDGRRDSAQCCPALATMAAAMTSSPDLASLGLESLELATLDSGLGPAGEAGGRTQGAGAASPSWPLHPGSGAAAWRLVCAAGAVGTTSRCCHCPARYATAAETEPAERRMTEEGKENYKMLHYIKTDSAIVSVTDRPQTPPTLGYCC